MSEILDNKHEIKQQDLFVANLAHDLKNPLLAQIISIELLLKGTYGGLNEEQSKILGYVLESNQYMHKMLCTLLQSYKSNHSEFVLAKTRFDVISLLQSCLDEISCFASIKNINILRNYITNKNVMICADVIQMRRLLSNLLNNALQHSSYNSCFEVGLKVKQNNIILSFSNVICNQSCEDFGHCKVSVPRESFGLGLDICKQIVAAHNGRIDFEFKSDKFIVLLELPKV